MNSDTTEVLHQLNSELIIIVWACTHLKRFLVHFYVVKVSKKIFKRVCLTPYFVWVLKGIIYYWVIFVHFTYYWKLSKIMFNNNSNWSESLNMIWVHFELTLCQATNQKISYFPGIKFFDRIQRFSSKAGEKREINLFNVRSIPLRQQRVDRRRNVVNAHVSSVINHPHEKIFQTFACFVMGKNWTKFHLKTKWVRDEKRGLVLVLSCWSWERDWNNQILSFNDVKRQSYTRNLPQFTSYWKA